MDVIYLDHNSTTPMAEEAAAAMAQWQTGKFGNPASQHQIGRRARQAIEDAREGIGEILGAQMSGRRPDRVVFTSGGTEANNLAIFGLVDARNSEAAAGEAIVSVIEHHSVAAAVAELERRGWTIHRLGVTREGVIQLAALGELINDRTRLVSVMLANNETGVVQRLGEISEICAARGIPLHTDGAQMVGKLPVDFRALGVASLSVAAHKFNGPLGIGALIVRGDIDLPPLLFGGFQQAGLRPGTESVALAVGMHAALGAWQREYETRTKRIAELRNRLETGLARGYDGELVVNGAGSMRLPNTSNVAFVGLDRQALLMALDMAGVCCSTGSACASGSSEPSPTLSAMGCSKGVLASSLRFSLGASTTVAEIDEAVHRIVQACTRLAHAKPSAGAGR